MLIYFLVLSPFPTSYKEKLIIIHLIISHALENVIMFLPNLLKLNKSHPFIFLSFASSSGRTACFTVTVSHIFEEI